MVPAARDGTNSTGGGVRRYANKRACSTNDVGCRKNDRAAVQRNGRKDKKTAKDDTHW